jgi:hypothetical protein
MDFVDITANLCNPQLHHFSPRSIHLCIFWLILNIHRTVNDDRHDDDEDGHKLKEMVCVDD